MAQFSNVDIKTDLVYKGVNYEWQFTNYNMEETVENVMENIISEDVGTNIKGKITLEQLENLKLPLRKMICKKISINNQLEKFIVKNKKKEESGSSVGILIFPFLQKLIPLDLVGGAHNRFHILTGFRKALKSGLKDTIPLKPLVRGLQTRQVCWLQSVQCNETKIQMMARLVKWLWKITKRIIASKFYVTEAQGSFKLLYIPKKIWQSRTDQKLNSMIHLGILQPVPVEEVESLEAKRRYAEIRFLPKSEGLRPISFLKKDPNEGSSLINKKKDSELRAFIQFLMNKTKNPSRLKPQQLHSVWRSIVRRIGADRSQQAHLVTLDVKDAYGSIVQDVERAGSTIVSNLLKRLCQTVLLEEKLLAIVRIATTICFGSCNQDSFIKFTITKRPKKDVFTCDGLCKAQAAKSTDKVSLVKLDELLERVTYLVKCQTVKRMNKSYLLKKGISQAVPVSAALCDLYLSYFTKTQLSEFTANKEDTLLRAMDDFLYVTPDRGRAELFVKKMSAGFPSFNINIKQAKTQSTLNGNSRIDYFGFQFDQSLQVYVKYINGADLSFRNTMTFTFKKAPIDTLVDRMQRIPTFKLNKLTLDPAYISVKVVCWNVFYTACLMACSFKATVDTIGSALFKDTDKLLNCIRHSSASVAARAFRIRAKNDVFIRELSWIALRAYSLCLTKNNTQDNTFFGSLTQRLEAMEHEARKKVRPRLIEHISCFVQFLPSQFKTGY